ncbi:lecithin retinol acyltransferase family protein [Thermoleptolyngbya sp. PKUAC-SCTB121]|uniref:lecithin retinol acyltransferase family protein n=1 Tax=Thermoleptolyngbya sp. PKUAC-SCTB121 TaxID=2811482 RepID=UPI002106AC24|nr:lecithin retinol acyltransferase family protein [Thermoleptolyngbya sp. PKUAC-SCTB121]
MRPLAGMDGVYEHHGIDCGDGSVIHYSKATEPPTIRQTEFSAFSWGNRVFVKQYTVCYLPDIVIERAESRLGEQRYSLLENNCEHFATWCKTGRSVSEQLATFGLDAAMLNPRSSRRMMEDAVLANDPAMALQQFDQARRNMAIACDQLQRQMQVAQKDMDTWHRIAELALKQGKEPAARAALERKVAAKRELTDYQSQLDQLDILAADLERNAAALHQRIALSTSPEHQDWG